MTIRVGVLTISDRAHAQAYEDRSGPMIESMMTQRLGWHVVQRLIVPDERALIEQTLMEWADREHVQLILTTGGTGFAPRDITPEATRAVLDREAPGIAEAMRYSSLQVTPHAMLSRGVSGIRGSTLIVNLPGSPRAVKENLETLLPVLPHAIDLLMGAPGAEAGHRRPQMA